MMAIAGIIPAAKWLAKIKQRSDVSCRLCKGAREQRRASTANLLEETYGHTNSAFCDGMATCITANHFIWRHLYASMQAAQTQRVSSGLSHLIKRGVSTRCGRRESLSRHASAEKEKTVEIETTISVKAHERPGKHHDFELTMLYGNRIWNRRPDGIGIGSLLPTQQEAEYSFSGFIPTNKQTNKQTSD